MGRPLLHHVAHKYGWGYIVLYIALMIFVVFGLFNVIAAIYVDNVMAAAKSDEQRLRKQRLSDEDFFNQKIFDLIQVVWDVHLKARKEEGLPTLRTSGVSMLDQVAVTLKRMENMDVTAELFNKVLLDPRAQRVLEDLEVAEEDQANLFDMLDVDNSGTLELPELYEG